MSWLLLVVVAVVVVVPVLVALVGAVTVGRRSGYDVDAYVKAYQERKAAGEVPDVMTQEPVSLGVGGADQ